MFRRNTEYISRPIHKTLRKPKSAFLFTGIQNSVPRSLQAAENVVLVLVPFVSSAEGNFRDIELTVTRWKGL